MKNARSNSERAEFIVGFVFIFTAFLVSLYYNGDKESIFELIPNNLSVPLTSILLPVVHGSLALWALFLVFKPNIKCEVIILQIESFVTILTGTEMLGIFFFYGSIAVAQIDESFGKTTGKTTVMMVVLHFISIFGMFRHGWARVFLAIGTSAFYLSFMLWIYHLLREKFSSFLSKATYENEVIKEKPGEVIHLKDYGLTERQVSIVKDYIYNQTPYKDLAEKYITSLSSIKKDFSIIFQKFGVSNIQELNFLLSQYQLD